MGLRIVLIIDKSYIDIQLQIEIKELAILFLIKFLKSDFIHCDERLELQIAFFKEDLKLESKFLILDGKRKIQPTNFI